MKNEKLIKQTSLIIGLLLFFFGGGMLLWTVGNIPFFLSVFPLLSICLGILFLYLVYYLDFNEVYLFLGMFLIQGAILWIIKHKLPQIYLSSFWPAFLLISGLTLLPYSLRRKRKRRSIFLVPSISFIILSLFFLPFSLGFSPIGLGAFTKRWWPVSFLVLGVVLMVAHFRKSLKIKRKESDSR